VRTNGATSVTFNVTAPATGYVDTTVAMGTAYTYKVNAVNGTKLSAVASVNVTTPAQGAVQPTAVAASTNATRVQVTWANNNASSFVIERSTNGAAFVQIGTAANGSNSFNNNIGGTGNLWPVVATNTYSYRVIALRTAAGVTTRSVPSSTVAVPFLVPGAPTGLNATAVTRATANDRVTLVWTAPTLLVGQPAITSSTVQWSLTADFTVVAGSATVNGTAVTTSVLVPRGTRATPTPAAYYFRVRSNNVPGVGAASLPLGPVSTL
jgi:hypothetical protein